MPSQHLADSANDTANPAGPASAKLTVVVSRPYLYPCCYLSLVLKDASLVLRVSCRPQTEVVEVYVAVLSRCGSRSPRCRKRRNPGNSFPRSTSIYTLNPLVRASFQAKQTREGGDPTQAEIGPSIDFYLKPWIKLQNATVFDLDEAKKRALVFSVGYRVLPSPDAAVTNRFGLGCDR